MKKITIFLMIAGLVVLGGARLETRAQANRSPLQMLQSLKEQNQKVLDQQTATLQKLDEVSKDADQLKAFSKRS